MPALEAFGRKWRIGSDDFVFPYVGSILTRFMWFALFGYVILTYNGKYSCDDEKILKIYLFVLTGLHFCMCLIEVVVVVISARGTIANPEPRKRLHIALYFQMGFFVVEFAWDIVGVVWAFDSSIDCHRSHSVLLLTRTVLVWNLTSSLIIMLYMVIRIGFCRLTCCSPPKKMRYEHLAPSTSFGGRRLSALSSGGLVQHHRQRRWQWRMQWLCGCLTLRENQKGIFSQVSASLADAFTHFRGYVPSDIVAGMALFAMEQSESKNADWEDTDMSERRRHMNFDSKAVCKHFNKVVHYMKFAAGSYGWHGYLFNKGIVLRLCKLMCSENCCQKQTRKGDLEEGETEESEEQQLPFQGGKSGWDTKALKHAIGLKDEDLVYVSFTSEVFCPAFYVVYDHQEKAVVVAIRGTMAVQDVLTDLSAEPGILCTSESGDILAHKGMMSSAHAVQIKLESGRILEKAFAEYPNYRLVLTGHSLGAGVASLLAILLKPKHLKLQCYAYSPPGCVISMSAISHTRSFITSVVVGSDFLARVSFQSFETFSNRVLHCIQTSHLPKYRIFLDSFLHWLGLCRPQTRGGERRLSVTELAIQREPLLNSGFEANYDEEEEYIHEVVEDVKEAAPGTDPVTGKRKVQPRAKTPLFLPGRIIHITWGTTVTKCCGTCKDRALHAHWTAQSEFSELTLEKNMVKHHMPGTVQKALLTLQTQENLLTVV